MKAAKDKGIHRGTVLLVALVALASTGLIACGVDEEREAAREEAEEELADLRADLEEANERLEEGEACAAELRPFARALTDLDSLLDVGLNQQEHNRRVQQISIAYSRLDLDDFEFGCLSEALHGEKAFNQYNKADDVWNECIVDFGCDIDSIDPQLQRHWATAAREVRQLNNGIESLTEDVEEEIADLEQQIEETEQELEELQD